MKVISVLKRSLRIKSPVKLLIILLFLIALSCQKDEFEKYQYRPDELSVIPAPECSGTSIVDYFPQKTFTITSKKNLYATKTLSNRNYDYLENFIITVQNGSSTKTKVTKLEIVIDGVLVVSNADFRKNLNVVQKPITLTKKSLLKVKLYGTIGRFVKIKISGSLKKNTIRDIEGNYYHTVKICDQWWMAENLKTTKMNDGTPIKIIYDQDDWWGHTIPTYCWYNHDKTYKDVYGALYDWYAVTSGKLCPVGWHAPSDEEFQELTDCLGGSQVAGGKLKEAGMLHWQAPNTGATNESGFTALPGGMRDMGGVFSNLGTSGFFRSTAEHGDGAQANGWNVYSYNTAFSVFDWERTMSFSVRCVKD
ncbi:MAG TPA: fibrobacter succinogenes major paralogous domain-containing protein [Bacteroidales bacterium]|nr:fibrobacter succinogenes major paralogous domain-containing protein [Bacteroidales bacterium]